MNSHRRARIEAHTVVAIALFSLSLTVRQTDAAWVEQGPGPNVVSGPGYTQVTGAVEVVAPHPTNPNRVFIGATNGGIWRTDNATDPSPTWVPLTDDQPSLSITAIAFDPLDASHQTLYAGFGRSTRGITHVGSASGPLPGLLLKTTDGGASWSQVRVDEIAYSNVRKILPTTIVGKSGQVILVATSYRGVYRSTNGGRDWKLVLDSQMSDLVEDPSTPSRMFAVRTFGSVLRSDDGGATWADLPGSPSGYPMHLAISPTQDEIGRHWLYAAVGGGNVFYTNDAGSSWTAMDAFPDGSHPIGTEQGVTQIAVSPTNPRQPFCAGDAPSWWRGDAGAAPGGQWYTLSGAHTAGTDPHGDSRSWTFTADPTILFESDDGGVYRLRNASSASPVWESAIGNLRVTEFLTIAYDRVHATVFGSAWDNSIPSQTTPNGQVWNVNELLFGDGCQVGVDNGTPGTSVHYSSQQYLFGAQRRVVSGSTTTTPLGLDIQVGPGSYLHYNFLEGDIYTDNDNDLGTVRFDQTFAVNKVDGTRMVIGTDYLYESFDRGDHFVSLGGIGQNVENDPIPLNPVGTVTSYAYGHPLDANELVVGTYGPTSLWIRRGSAGYPNPVTTYPGGYPIDVAIDPNDPDRIYVLTGGGTVWRTVDAGASAAGWTNLTATRGSATSDAHTIELIYASGGGPLEIAVGGLGGVFVTTEADDRGWWRLGQTTTGWFPNAIVSDLAYDATADVLVAGTYGRGAWTLPAASTQVDDGPCGTAPRSGCRNAAVGGSSLSMAMATKPSLTWKWASSGAVTFADYGAPDLATGYTLCVYDASGSGLRASATVPTGPFVWKVGSKGYSYKSKTGLPEGVTGLSLKIGTPGKEQLKAKGTHLQTPTGALAAPVRVQLQRSDGSSCTEATFSAPTVNDGIKFKAKSD